MTFSKKWCILLFMKPYIHKNRFTVKYCEADFKDELKPSALLAYFEEAACSSADELGFGYAYVKPRGFAFMVSNICCEFLKPVALGATVTVNTWPLPPSRVVFGREYFLEDAQGERLVNASSRWCLIDMRTGKLLPSSAIDNQDYTTYNTDKVLADESWRIPPFALEEGELKFSIRIANSEYDHNMHVNNTKYADYCFNCFSVQELSKRRLRRFSLSYIKQCKENELLRFYLKKAEAGYFVQGVNEQDETVTRAHIVFAE